MPAARSLHRPSAPANAVAVSSTYEDLLRDVRSALFTGRERIEYAWLMMVEKFRLRGIDCPGMNTAGGKAAKRFVEGLMSDARGITAVTSKVDKYDRYLADVFLEGNFPPLPAASKPSEDGSALDSQPREAPIFLNNVLLENGHAIRLDGSHLDDWSP